MSLYYTHMLIPDQVDYAPCPSQLVDFFASLIEIGVAPVNPNLETQYFELPHGKRKGWKAQFWIFRHPLTQKKFLVPHYTAKFKDVAELREVLAALKGADEYEVAILGSGPPKLALLPLGTCVDGRYVAWDGPGELEVRCHLRSEIVSTCGSLFSTPLGSACSGSGYFTNPSTGETIVVPNAGCARFWITFHFGKFLFPEMKDNCLDLLSTPVVDAAHKAFSTRFNQGCSWG